MGYAAQVGDWKPMVLLALLAVGTGCPPLPPRNTHDADVRSITEGEALWVRPWSARDVEGIVAPYTNDAMVMAPNTVPVIGREAIREMVKQIVRDGNFALTFETARVDVAKSCDYGFAQGSYILTMTDQTTKKPYTDRGSYLRIYRKQLDGAWKVSREMRASSLPAGSGL
jgi:ketosteroid isomerase-like protein